MNGQSHELYGMNGTILAYIYPCIEDGVVVAEMSDGNEKVVAYGSTSLDELKSWCEAQANKFSDDYPDDWISPGNLY